MFKPYSKNIGICFNIIDYVPRGDIKKEGFREEVVQAAIIDAKYEGYLAKQERLVANLKNLENKKVPLDLDYGRVIHLRAEAMEKLSAFRPGTLAQASRIGGITPADVTVLRIHLKKYYQLH